MPNEPIPPPVAQLRQILTNKNDAELEAFLHGYTVGSAAEIFINFMQQPGQRAMFLVAIAKSYPEDWNAALKQLAG